MVAKKTAVPCPKCDGAGSIQAFGHIANGVCFCCKGNKTVWVNLEALKAKLSDDTKKKAAWVLASTESSYYGRSFKKLLKIRDFCHGGGGLQQAYPSLWSHWMEVGEPVFQAVQDHERSLCF